MQLHYLPWFRVVTALFQHPLTLLGVLLCVVPVAAPAQSVTFAGALTTLPTSGINDPYGIAVDRAGDVFIVEGIDSQVVELPKTASGYGPQTTLPTSGLILFAVPSTSQFDHGGKHVQKWNEVQNDGRVDQKLISTPRSLINLAA